jgi:hypothetical protein
VSAPPEIGKAFARYFAAERRGAVTFLAAGLAALTLSLGLALSRTAYRGMIPPLGVLGLVEIVVGATGFLRTPSRVEEDARGRERERMRRVIASFRIYKVAETVVLTAGLTLMMLFPRHTVLYASGLGCLLQASVLLVLDRVAERRAREYASGLEATSWRGPGPDRA